MEYFHVLINCRWSYQLRSSQHLSGLGTSLLETTLTMSLSHPFSEPKREGCRCTTSMAVLFETVWIFPTFRRTSSVLYPRCKHFTAICWGHIITEERVGYLGRTVSNIWPYTCRYHRTVSIKFSFHNRILLQHCEEFSAETKHVPKHIPSKYSSEMAKKSKTVTILAF